jgi:cutinase
MASARGDVVSHPGRHWAKTIDLCIPEDPVCSPDGNDSGAHGLYAVNGMAGQAVDFAARRLSSSGLTP